MTVCIAAIALDGSIIAVSDRMLTDTDVTYEPKVSNKVFKLGLNCFAMNSGSEGIQSEIMAMMQAKIYPIFEKTKDWFAFTVKGMVDLYIECYNEVI